MILVLFTWLIAGFSLLMIGFYTTKIISRFAGRNQVVGASSPDEIFFMGFMIVSVFSGLISVLLPVNGIMLLIVTALSLVILVFYRNELKLVFKENLLIIKSFSRIELLLILFVILFVLSAVVHRITLGDTESYHAQSIQWIRKFPVVPGLGNIHGRLAFNSMFFVISGLFTFQADDVLIYPLNGICYLVVAIRLVTLGFNEFRNGIYWRGLFYILLMLISVLILLPDLNSPAPDVICSIIIIYVVTMVVNNRIHLKTIDCQKYILISLAVFTCLSYKLSSLFLIFIIIPALGKTFFRRIVLSAGIGVIVLSSFFIRNYYLSGYLVYPYPKADIFKTDWKIPIINVHEMKIEIENWARIPSVPSSEISKMGLQGWVPVWFKALNFYNKLLVAVNLFLFLLIPVSLFRKDYLISGIQFIILINLAFWFIMAPDPRFSYGFLFSGFAFSIAYFSGLFEKSIPGVFPKLTKIGLICFIVVIIGRRIMSPVGTIINPDLWLVPDKFGTVSTNEYDAGFKYRVPVEDRGCCNTDLPCVPYQLTDVVLRGKDLQDGFKVLISNKNNPNE